VEVRVHPRFPDYDVRADGRVFRARWTPRKGQGNYPRFGEIKGRVLKSGYRQFKLCTFDGRQELVRANRLVAETFLGPPPSDEHQAAHNDGVKLNNCAGNLRWATPKENAADQDLHGTRRRGELVPTAKLTNEQAAHIRREFTGARGEIARFSRQFNAGRNAIYRVIDGKTYSDRDLDKKQGEYA
jgi:hypothetical protein